MRDRKPQRSSRIQVQGQTPCEHMVGLTRAATAFGSEIPIPSVAQIIEIVGQSVTSPIVTDRFVLKSAISKPRIVVKSFLIRERNIGQ